MQSVGGQGLSATGGVRVLAPSSTPSAAADDASPTESTAVQEGSGPASTRRKSARSSLPLAAALYAECFGWPILIEDSAVTVTCGDVLDITTMPAGFASQVNQLLRLQFMMAPILELAAATADESSRWAFFSQPRQPTCNDHRSAKLSICDVQHFGPGTKFPLPANPTCGSDGMTWRVPSPFGVLTTPLPPWWSIVSCVLKVDFSRSQV